MATSDVPYVTKAMIQEYLDLEERRKALNREATDLGKRASAIAEKLEAYVTAKGGKERSVVRSGYRLSIKLANGFVPWKQEFIRVAGQEEANRLTRECPKREVLAVDPA